MSIRTIALCALVGFGCAKGPPDDLPNVVQPNGKVVLASGKSPRGTMVELKPNAPDGHAAYGVVKPDGSFTLQTRGGQPGVVPGVYTATVIPSTREETPPVDIEYARKVLPINHSQEVTIAAGQAELILKVMGDREP